MATLAPGPSAMSEASRLGLLERSPFLRLLPGEVRQEVSRCFTEHTYAFGDVIVAEGAPSDAYYLLTSGRVRVLKAGRNGRELPLHTLTTGESFGEIGLLNGGIRTATVRASSAVTVLRLERRVFLDLLARTPDLHEYMQLQLQHRTLFAFLKQLTSFGNAPLGALQELLLALRPVSCAAGETIVRQDDPAGAMYFIEQGQVKIHQTRHEKRRNLAFLRAGDYFGELSLLQHTVRQATAEAVTACRLLALDPEPMARILGRHPALREVVERRLAQYNQRDEAPTPLDFATTAPQPGEPLHTLTHQRPVLPTASRELDLSAIAAAPAAPPPPRRRSSFVHLAQIDESDCGAAALGMVCSSFGKQVNLALIRELSNTAVNGTGLNDICRAANELGLTAQAIKKPSDHLAELPLPAILHWQHNHWVVLLERKGDLARLADPAGGVSWLPQAEVARHWTGYAAIFDYTAALEEAPERRRLWSWLFPLVQPLWSRFFLIGSLTLLICALQAVLPRLLQITVDEIIAARDVARLNQFVLYLGGALIGTLLLTVIQRYLLGYTAAQVDGKIMGFILDKLLFLPMTYFNNRRPSDIQRRLESVRAARYFLVHHGATGLLASVQIVTFLVLMALFSLPMMLVFFGIMAPLYFGLLYFSGKILRPAFQSLELSELRFQHLQAEVIKGIEVVKASGGEARYRDRTVDSFVKLIRDQSQSKFNIFCYEGTVQAIWFMSIIVLIWLGAQLVMDERISIGVFLAFQVLLAMIYTPVQTIVNLWEDLQSSTGFINTLTDIVEATPEQRHEHGEPQAVPSLAGKVEARGISFHYGGPDSTAVLHHLDCTIQPGQKIAIVGRSGSGKTTLVKCLAALIRPTRGTMLYDDVDAERVRHSDLRRHIGLVLNENYFFSGSVLANIAFGDAQPNAERATWAARVANAHDFIMQLPEGYQSDLDESRGVVLSNGQRQSLAIARALYRDPAILILDEATSALDIETERLIYERLAELYAKRTFIVVTHRLNLIADADQILVLNRGRLVEQGSHEDLLQRRGLYYHLIRRQVE